MTLAEHWTEISAAMFPPENFPDPKSQAAIKALNEMFYAGAHIMFREVVMTRSTEEMLAFRRELEDHQSELKTLLAKVGMME